MVRINAGVPSGNKTQLCHSLSQLIDIDVSFPSPLPGHLVYVEFRVPNTTCLSPGHIVEQERIAYEPAVGRAGQFQVGRLKHIIPRTGVLVVATRRTSAVPPGDVLHGLKNAEAPAAAEEHVVHAHHVAPLGSEGGGDIILRAAVFKQEGNSLDCYNESE